jgi:hypothetical protein
MVAIRAGAREVPVLKPADVRFGSQADVTLLNFDVRFTPESGHSPTRSGCLLWAKNGLMQRNKNIAGASGKLRP